MIEFKEIKFFKDDAIIDESEVIKVFTYTLYYNDKPIIKNLRELLDILHKAVRYYIATNINTNEVFNLNINSDKSIYYLNNENNIEFILKYYDSIYKIEFIKNIDKQHTDVQLLYAAIQYLSDYFDNDLFISLSYKHDIDKYKKEIESQ